MDRDGVKEDRMKILRMTLWRSASSLSGDKEIEQLALSARRGRRTCYGNV